jgi:hypothetical protein
LMTIFQPLSRWYRRKPDSAPPRTV